MNKLYGIGYLFENSATVIVFTFLYYPRLERLKEAVESFTKAIQLDQFFIDAFIGRGNAFMDYGHDIGLMYAR